MAIAIMLLPVVNATYTLDQVHAYESTPAPINNPLAIRWSHDNAVVNSKIPIEKGSVRHDSV